MSARFLKAFSMRFWFWHNSVASIWVSYSYGSDNASTSRENPHSNIIFVKNTELNSGPE